MSINKDSQKAPNLRFKGFTDDWEQRELGEMFDIVSGYAFKMSDYVQNGIPIVNGESIQHGNVSTKNLNFLPEEFSDKFKGFILNTGDIILGLNRPITNGKLKIAQVPTDLHGALLYQRAGKIIIYNSDIKFSYQLLGKEITEFVLKEAVGSDQPFISTTKLKKWLIIIPTLDEQLKIGKFFGGIDNLITLHQRKLDQLNQLKEALLQQMFPGKGETVPKLRFAGFEEDWEERKLGSIYDFSKGKGLPLNSFTYSKDDPAIAYGHLYTKYSEVISEVYLSSDDDGVLSKENDLLFPGSSTVPNGTAQANAIMLNNVKLGGDIIIARPKQDIRILSIFMSYQINSQRQKLFPITVGTTIAHMYGKDLSKVKFFITNYSEQEKIGSLLEKLDNKIIFQQRKLDQLKNMKQVLLQNMFI